MVSRTLGGITFWAAVPSFVALWGSSPDGREEDARLGSSETTWTRAPRRPSPVTRTSERVSSPGSTVMLRCVMR